MRSSDAPLSLPNWRGDTAVLLEADPEGEVGEILMAIATEPEDDPTLGVLVWAADIAGVTQEAVIEGASCAVEGALPIFLIPSGAVEGDAQTTLGWIQGVDRELGMILVGPEEGSAVPVPDSEPFELFGGMESGTDTRRTRPGQRAFQFAVFARYGRSGLRCAVCGMRRRELLQVAHICASKDGGVDHPLNGLVLCANHHLALDRGLWAIDPTRLQIRTRPDGPTAEDLEITVACLTGDLLPHPAALEYAWDRWTAQ